MKQKIKGQPAKENIQRRDGYIKNIIPKTISRTRADIATWNAALRQADNVDNPRRVKLYNLLDNIMLDAHLTAQVELRRQNITSATGALYRDGEIDEQETKKLHMSPAYGKLIRHTHDTSLYNHSLVELITKPTGELDAVLIPRKNVIPEKGLLLYSEDALCGLDYRDTREYGTWLLELQDNASDYGLLNKAVPSVLFKRFATGCWSELCEIYGIPPRFIKTNTQDAEMLDRAEQMLRDMGSAAYFIIDNEEEFGFAKGADTNGDVYNNLISLCKEELSLLLNGAMIGQDTRNGNRSKEEVGLSVQDKIIQSERRRIEQVFNSIVLPALYRIGFLSTGLTFAFQQEEDIEKLWKMTSEILPYKEVDDNWIREKFGIQVTGNRSEATPQNLSYKDGFFD